MLCRTIQIPIWPRCCGFRFYFWEGQRDRQLFLESWAAGFWLKFSLFELGVGWDIPAEEGAQLLPPPSSVPALLGVLGNQIVPLAAGATCFAWCWLRPWIGGFSCKIVPQPHLKQQWCPAFAVSTGQSCERTDTSPTEPGTQCLG